MENLYLKYWLLSKIKNEILDLQLRREKLIIRHDKEKHNIKKLRIMSDIELISAEIFNWENHELKVMEEINALATI